MGKEHTEEEKAERCRVCLCEEKNIEGFCENKCQGRREQLMNNEKTELLDFMDYVKGAMRIEYHDLVTECQMQPSFYTEVASRCTELRKEAKKAKSLFKYISSKIYIDIKQNPEKYNLTKVTGELITAAIVIQAEYKEAELALFDVEEDAEMIQVLVEACSQRKSMIRDCVQLHSQNYQNSEMHLNGPKSKVGDADVEAIKQLRKNKAEKKDE